MTPDKNNLTMESVNCLLCGSRESVEIASGYDYEYRTSEKLFTAVECSSCGHVYLNPRPVRESWPIIYPPTYYTFTGRHSGQSSKIIAYLKKNIVRRRLSGFEKIFRTGGSILEIGSGDCSLLIDIKSHYPEINITGNDLAFTDSLKSRSTESGITLIEGAIEDAALPSGEYDLVVMNQLIEHLWDPIRVLKKIHDSMRPGGMLSIETVNIDAYDRKIIRGGYWGAFYFPRHLNLFGFKSLGRLLGMTGFETVRQYSLMGPINWAFSFHALTSGSIERPESRISKFFTDKNPICLGIFTFFDFAARSLGLTTSNQKTIARKK